MFPGPTVQLLELRAVLFMLQRPKVQQAQRLECGKETPQAGGQQVFRKLIQ